MTIRVLIADDHDIVRDGLRFILEANADIQIVAEAENGLQAIAETQKHQPEIVIIDISMPEMNGIEAVAQIRNDMPSTEVIFLSIYATREYIYRALRTGAKGYLLKESASTEIIDAVYAVQRGNRYLSRKISDSMIDEYLQLREAASENNLLDRLSQREREVLQLVAEGNSSSQIAEKLFLSPGTVDSYRSRLMIKLGIKDLPGLIKFAIQHGIIVID
jgi:DNA-binding NarL/FixJ family response regulator